jgi:endonuclease/exonuclease/phosphatase family metal-dependent hydrolase
LILFAYLLLNQMNMKNYFLFLVGAVLAMTSCSTPQSAFKDTAAASSGAEARDPEQLRILCYNIHYANPPSKPGVIDVDAIARVIVKEKPDIVALQEVDVNVGRSGRIDEAKLLAEKSGMKAYFFAKAIDHDGGDYGVAILSNLDLLEMHKYPLPDDPEVKSEPRVLAAARMKTARGFEFIFATTHLEVRGESNRLIQMEEIAKIAKATSLPMIIAGDFNSMPGSEPIKRLDQLFQRTCEPCDFTIPVINPNRAIDFIAFRPDNKFEVVSHKVIPETYASDHLPIFSVLKIKQ